MAEIAGPFNEQGVMALLPFNLQATLKVPALVLIRQRVKAISCLAAVFLFPDGVNCIPDTVSQKLM